MAGLRTSTVLAGVFALTLASGALLAEPVLHEYFDVAEAPHQRGTTAAQEPVAGFPFQLDTPSGAVDAPPKHRAADPAPYALTQSASEQYRLDGDTSRPDLVGYSDPFTPSVLPFKRSFSYDTVTEGFELTVADSRLSPLKIGGAVRRGDDQFFADIALTVRAGQAVRVPSVGPQARILAAQLQPPAEFEVLRDSADNWFIRTPPGDYRLIMHLAIDRRVFGSPFAATSWDALGQHLPPIPPGLKRQTAETLRRLGLNQNVPPVEGLASLVQHFRSFAPSDKRQLGSGVQLYRSITMSKAGVCRHRSFAFAVTALALGIPTRFVRNEAHAWVEVFDGSVWHRIDLGGAAGRMEMASSVDVPHAPPTDPFAWPSGSESGTDMAAEALSSLNPPGPGPDTAGGQASPSSTAPSESGAALDEETPGAALDEETPGAALDEETPGAALDEETPGAALDEETPGAALDERSTDPPTLRSLQDPTTVSLATRDARVTRGRSIQVEGQVHGQGENCDLTRVDIKLQGAAGQWFPLGTLVTDKHGHYRGQITVPRLVPVGDYKLFAATPGSQYCAAGSSLDPASR